MLHVQAAWTHLLSLSFGRNVLQQAGMCHTAYPYNALYGRIVFSAYFNVLNVPNGRMTHPWQQA